MHVFGEMAAVSLGPKARRAFRPAFARVDVYRDPADILACWAELETAAPCSVYQTRAWLRPWIDTLGAAAGISPLFIVARCPDGRPTALFCLGVTRQGPFRVATWLGGADANLNMPLLGAPDVWTKTELMRLLRTAARRCGDDRPHVFLLTNQPGEWEGSRNPLAVLRHQPSPSDVFETSLKEDATAVLAEKLSNATRKKLRKKEARLAELGAVSYRVVRDPAEQAVVVETFLAQKLRRFEDRKIASNFADDAMRRFILTASTAPEPGIELHALYVGTRIAAVYGGGRHANRWSGMFNSFDGDEQIARSSPADILLMRIVEKACQDGIRRFDLGIGEARYKSAYCDQRLPLFDALVPIGPVGIVAAEMIGFGRSLKRGIKANPYLYGVAKRLKWMFA